MAHVIWNKNTQTSKTTEYLRVKRKKNALIYASLALNIVLILYVIIIS